MTFGAVLGKDARVLMRSPALLVTLVVYPLLLVLVVGLAFANPPEAPTLAVVNGDAAPADPFGSGAPVNFTTADFVALAGQTVTLREVATEAEARALVRGGLVDGALLIPEGFLDRALQMDGRVNVTLIVDESDPVRSAGAEAAVRAGLQQFGQRVVEEKIRGVRELLGVVRDGTVVVPGVEEALAGVDVALAAMPRESADYRNLTGVRNLLYVLSVGLARADPVLEGTAAPIRVEAESVTSGVLDLRDVVLPAAAAFSVFWTGTLAAAALVAEEREGAAFRRVRASPAPFRTFLAAKATLALGLVLVQALLLLVVADVAWGRPPAPAALTAVALGVVGLAAAGLGVFLASFARGPGEASLFSVLVLVPMMFVAGVFYPLAYMPGPVAAVAEWLPMTQAATLLREVLLKAPTVAVAAPLLGGLALTAAVLFGVGAWVAGRREM